nr:sulfite exporter TauE/SafE family protein [Clostridium lundense]
MEIKKVRLKVYNMTCNSCEKRIEKDINTLPGIIWVKANFKDGIVEIHYDDRVCNINKIKSAIEKAGYHLTEPGNKNIIGILIIGFIIWNLSKSTNGFNMETSLNNASYFALFVIGLLTSIHCVGMCGGIMLSQSIVKEKSTKLEAIKPAILYNLGRVLSYTVLGGAIGALGSLFSLSLFSKAIIQIIAAIFMIIMGFNLAGFNLFKKFYIKLPWNSCSLKRKFSSPFLVGILNGFMPCGPLQTLQIYALSTGSAFKGALSMFIFSLGTVPLMFSFGTLSGLLSKKYTKNLLRYSGILIIFLGLIMGNRGLALMGFNNPLELVSSSKLLSNNKDKNLNITKPIIKDGVQIINITADSRGYTPNVLYVQKNTPVKLIIDGKSLNYCNNEIIFSSLDIQKKLESGENVIEFTPNNKDINFSCWMGMIRGYIKVVDDINSTENLKPGDIVVPNSSTPSCCSPTP